MSKNGYVYYTSLLSDGYVYSILQGRVYYQMACLCVWRPDSSVSWVMVSRRYQRMTLERRLRRYPVVVYKYLCIRSYSSYTTLSRRHQHSRYHVFFMYMYKSFNLSKHSTDYLNSSKGTSCSSCTCTNRLIYWVLQTIKIHLKTCTDCSSCTCKIV